MTDSPGEERKGRETLHELWDCAATAASSWHNRVFVSSSLNSSFLFLSRGLFLPTAPFWQEKSSKGLRLFSTREVYGMYIILWIEGREITTGACSAKGKSQTIEFKKIDRSVWSLPSRPTVPGEVVRAGGSEAPLRVA